jgi:pimeloyl-ACP methyl ester carboxylesterase
MQLSWYILLFQFPGLAEELIPQDDWRFLKGWSGGTGDIDRWPEDLGRPGALTAALNWYRANDNPMRMLQPTPAFPPIQCPVLGIFGAHDAALTEESMTDSEKYVSGPWRYEHFEDAGHWVQLEQPARLNEMLIEFLRPDQEGSETDARALLAKHDTSLADRLREARRGT